MERKFPASYKKEREFSTTLWTFRMHIGTNIYVIQNMTIVIGRMPYKQSVS